jgi:hypothetical protein
MTAVASVHNCAATANCRFNAATTRAGFFRLKFRPTQPVSSTRRYPRSDSKDPDGFARSCCLDFIEKNSLATGSPRRRMGSSGGIIKPGHCNE